MKKHAESSFDERFLEAQAALENDEAPADPQPVKSAPGFLRHLGILVLVAAVLGLLLFAPVLQDVVFIAALRSPFLGTMAEPGPLLTLSQLPSILWIGLLLLGAGLCTLGSLRKSNAPSGITANADSKPRFFGSNAEGFPAGLKPELIDRTMKRYDQHCNSCPDAFAAPPGIRLMTLTKDRNSIVSCTEKVYRWTPEGDHYIIEITGIIPGTIRFTMDTHGRVTGIGEFNGVREEYSLKFNAPLPVVRPNKDGDTIEKCYITLLGGM